MRGLKGKVALVTGGNKGVGRAISLRLANEGVSVAVNGTDNDAIEKTISEIKSKGGRAVGIKADVSNGRDVDTMVKQTVNALGEIGILVNNAGAIVVKPFLKQTEEDWDRVMDVNCKGAFLCCKAIVPDFIRRGGGKIVNIASEAGKVGTPLMVPYCASKHAMIGVTRALAVELAPHKINVNAICPVAITNTDMRTNVDQAYRTLGFDKPFPMPPWGRLVLPEDVANVVAFLASDDAEFISGQSINVSGGGLQD